MPRPLSSEYHTFYKTYIDKVEGEDVVSVLESSIQPLEEWLNSLKEADLLFSYAPGKWTIGQVLQHIIDTERVFSYRAMCIGRGEKQPLPGFDENEYAAAAPASGRKWKGLAEELLTLRKASIILFRSLEKENALHYTGMASNHPISVNALGFIMAGHVLHHKGIIGDRYL
ncbi:MAG: DinB family protein [Chitinophagaceae bacterium]|nr:DinB family protein [Chitinophagaceae bacterium]